MLECSLIKRYLPKYNILLKDDKGYPYLRLDRKEAYPAITMVNKLSEDGAEYFGPFGSRGVTQAVQEAIQAALKLPACKKQFPRDIGKDRPCLNYHMNRCSGWCQESKTPAQYRERVDQARQLLMGNYKAVFEQIRQEMLDAADRLDFELAASLRDRLQAVESLGKKQLVTAGTLADTDVIGYGESETKGCFAVLHFSGGNLLDKDYEVFSIPDDKENAVSALMKQYYLSRGFAPKHILLPFEIEDSELFAHLLRERLSEKTHLRVPQRGDFLRLVELANKNALEEAQRLTGKEEKHRGALKLLEKMLGLEGLRRIEAFDISNISGTDMVAGMVVFEEGKPLKRDYKRFQLEGMTEQDDYAAMHQVVTRRFRHFLEGDKGFAEKPDLLLIDGGVTHAETALRALRSLGVEVPVFGMVKDDRHRTRALVTPDGRTIRIDVQQTVFALIGNIQEEVHRFAITYHRQKRSKRLRYSELDRIPGIGSKRKELLLKSFHSIAAIRQASLSELERLLPKNAASAVYQYFHSDQ